MSDERFLIVDLLIKIIPLGLFIGLSIIFLMRWIKSRRNRVRERQVQTPEHSPEHNESAANEPEAQSRFYIIALLDALLFLYLLFSYEWSPGPGLSGSVGGGLGPLGVPIYYALVSARFGLQVLFFTCLGGSIYMSRFYVGRWPQWFKLSCLSSFAIGLAWLLYQWGLTAWRLHQSFPSDLPRGLHDLLITGLFSDCGIRLRGADAAVSIRQSMGMYLSEWLAAIYLVEKYLRLAVFHERRDERGPAWWARFTPLLPVLLIAGLVGLGLWGDFQRERMITHVARMELSVLQPQATLQWHTAVEQCADQGAGWRLPTMHELYVLSSGALGKDSRLGAAWSGELHEKGGPRGLRWTGRRHQRPTYIPDVMHRCLSAQPTDLYQRLVVSFYPDLYQQHRNDSFYRYFYPHEGFSVYGGLEGGEPEAVLCVKPDPTDPPGSLDLHLTKDVTLVTDVKTAASLLELLCNDTGYDPNYCHRSLVHRYTEVDRLGGEEAQDSLAVEQRFQKRLEECRLTADVSTCTGHGSIYLARGEYERLRPFYEEACKKDGVAYASCVHVLELDEREAAFGKVIDEVMSAGLTANRPSRHHEAKEPLMRACELGRAQSCGYLGYIFELQNRHSDAWQRYDKGCSLGYLWACTKLVFLNRKNIATEQTKQLLVDLCYKGESLACDTIAIWKWSEKEPDAQSALEFATRACSLGSRSGCAAEVVIRKLGNSPRIDELDPNSVQPSTPYDIKLFRSACIQNDIHCQGYVERLTLQGQFKEAEWFNEQACIEQRATNLKQCSERIPWRGLFESMSQVLMAKKYIKEL